MEFVLLVVLVTMFVPGDVITTADIDEKLTSLERVFEAKLKHIETQMLERVNKLEDEVTVLKHEKNIMSGSLVRSLRSKRK